MNGIVVVQAVQRVEGVICLIRSDISLLHAHVSGAASPERAGTTRADGRIAGGAAVPALSSAKASSTITTAIERLHALLGKQNHVSVASSNAQRFFFNLPPSATLQHAA